MGSSSSTRRITVVNDETSGVIKISDSVVNRLRGHRDEISNVPTPHKPLTVQEPSVPHPQQQTKATGTGRAVSVRPNTNTALADNPITPNIIKTEEMPPRNIRGNVGEEANRGGKEKYWKEKFVDLERLHTGILKQTAEEFSRGLQTVEGLFSSPTLTPVCENEEARVIRCYKDNQMTTLNCSKQVEAFANCVQAFRLRSLAMQG